MRFTMRSPEQSCDNHLRMAMPDRCIIANTEEVLIRNRVMYNAELNGVEFSVSNFKVTIGIIASEQVLPQVAWSVCGGAVGLALDKIREEYNFVDFDFRFLVGYSECDLARTLGLGIEYMSNQQADIVIGPPCPQDMLSIRMTLADAHSGNTPFISLPACHKQLSSSVIINISVHDRLVENSQIEEG
ncbi:hypothetical protein ANCCEY_06528 [Ancylostoma ceylanicum]|uniref:Receptor ligand binding region domain-containing protein n=1 Tax=Ancylostoma ceylanicum TaxID=53326 RepID=A0A0D6M3F4_9BILA|nr:hypothetical protein ANCCEY_06528 [Ancylostoma ceylanicum]